MSESMVPLSRLHVGEQGTVLHVEGGGSFQERVVSMGVHPGAEVRVLGGGEGGRMLLAVGDTRIGLGHGMAEKIMVVV